MRSALKQNLRKPRGPRNICLVLAGTVCAAMLIFCAGSLVRYMSDARRTASEKKMFQELYYAKESPAHENRTRMPVFTEYTVTLPPTAAPAPTETPEPAAAPWPENPEMTVSASISRLRKRNRDIIGWLSIPGVLELPVVQRDNEYYLGRDAMKLHNANGALFLEEHISLRSRPDTYIIFGHNMKTGEMFGSLRLYEHVKYYKQNAIINFNVMYEDGQYAVFSVADVDIVNGLSRYVPFMQLGSLSPGERNRCIRRLRQLSMIRSPLQVDAEDQLLILVTCDGSDQSRRVVAARRLREGESAEALKNTLQYASRRP